MGLYSDEAYFGQEEARLSGYSDGYNSGKFAVKAGVCEALGVDIVTVDDLLSRNIDSNLVALRAVAVLVKESIERQEKRLAMYSAGDSVLVAQALVADQTTAVDVERKGSTSSSDYTFERGQTGVIVRTEFRQIMTPKRNELSSGWVQDGLRTLGFEHEQEFCEEVVASLSDLVMTEVNNG